MSQTKCGPNRLSPRIRARCFHGFVDNPSRVSDTSDTLFVISFVLIVIVSLSISMAFLLFSVVYLKYDFVNVEGDIYD